MPFNGYYTLQEAADILEYKSTSTLRKLCIESKIFGAQKQGKTWFIPESWVNEQKEISPNGKGNRGVARKETE